MDSPSHALELLGGAASVAARLDRKLTTVTSWGSRQSIPVEVWPELVKLADERGIEGITYEALTQVHAEQVRRRKGDGSDEPAADQPQQAEPRNATPSPTEEAAAIRPATFPEEKAA
jgi:hypothetical protein